MITKHRRPAIHLSNNGPQWDISAFERAPTLSEWELVFRPPVRWTKPSGREQRRPLVPRVRAHLPEPVERDVCAGDGAPPLFPLVRPLGPAPQVQAQDPEVTRDLRALITVQGLHLLGQVVLTEGGNVEVLTRVEGCLSFRTSLDDGIQFIERAVPEIHQRPHHIRLDVPARVQPAADQLQAHLDRPFGCRRHTAIVTPPSTHSPRRVFCRRRFLIALASCPVVVVNRGVCHGEVRAAGSGLSMV
jgi:hypothetical protein